MKNIVFIIILLFLIIYKNAECQIGYFSYSYSHEFNNDINIGNHSLGYEHLFQLIEKNDIFGQWIGIFIRGINNNNPSIELKYEIDYFYFEGKGGFVFSFGPGINLLYNFNKNIFGICPQFDFMFVTGSWLKFNFIYRYNLYFKYENTHEIGFTVGLINIPAALFTIFTMGGDRYK